MAVAVPVVMFALFLGFYQYLRLRAGRAEDQRPRVQWGWLAAIIGAAAVALIIGAVIR